MSSNIRIKKICQHCGDLFTAKTTVTKFCSDDCAKKAYKKRKKDEEIEKTQQQTRDELESQTLSSSKDNTINVVKELVNVRELSVITSLSERTLFRLIKDKKFPKMKIGKRLVFNKNSVINYLDQKYGTV